MAVVAMSGACCCALSQAEPDTSVRPPQVTAFGLVQAGYVTGDVPTNVQFQLKGQTGPTVSPLSDSKDSRLMLHSLLVEIGRDSTKSLHKRHSVPCLGCVAV